MAQVLFDEAKGLMTLGNNAAACPKLAESYRLDPGTGTLTALAVCNEIIGKSASAWAEFLQVISEARQSGRTDREQFALQHMQHIAELEPKLSKLGVAIEPNVSSAPGFEVRRDGVTLGPAAWGTAVPVDPGEHIVEARADGKTPWWVKISIGKTPTIKTVTVPILEDVADPTAAPAPWIVPDTAPTAVAPGAPRAAEQSVTGFAGMSPSTQRVVGLTLGGVGVLAAGLATGFGVDAISKSNDAKSRCPSLPSCTDASAVNTNNDAKTSAVISDVAVVGAILTLGAGAALYFTAPSEAPAKRDDDERAGRAPAPGLVGLRLVPTMSARGGGFLIDARW
jgi:hypothetical protein